MGDRLAKARRAAGLDQHTMAHLLNTDRRTIGNYENERTTPSAGVVFYWAAITGVPVDWIDPHHPWTDWSAGRPA